MGLVIVLVIDEDFIHKFFNDEFVLPSPRGELLFSIHSGGTPEQDLTAYLLFERSQHMLATVWRQ
jgi:hypothetical protein